MSLLTRIQPRSDMGHRPTNDRSVDSLVLPRKVRREIIAEARQTASAGWTPTTGQPEPIYLQVIDHQTAAAAHTAAERHQRTQTAPLATMRAWLRATPAVPPSPGSHGPAARDRAHAAQQYVQLTDAADEALTVYDQNRHALAAELARIDNYRQTTRHTFTNALAAYHHSPDRLFSGHPPLDSAVTVAGIPDHPDAVETRRRFHQLRHTRDMP